MGRLETWARSIALREGSTRAIALMRIGLVLLVWARFGSKFTFFAKLDPVYIAVEVAFWVSTTMMLVGLFSRLSTAASGVSLIYGVFWFLGHVRGISHREPFAPHVHQ